MKGKTPLPGLPWAYGIAHINSLQEDSVRVVRPNLLFCVHQRYSEGVGQGEGESRWLSRSEGIVGGVVRGDGEEEVSNKSIQKELKEVEIVFG